MMTVKKYSRLLCVYVAVLHGCTTTVQEDDGAGAETGGYGGEGGVSRGCVPDPSPVDSTAVDGTAADEADEECDPLSGYPCSDGMGCYLVDDAWTCQGDASGEGGGAGEGCGCNVSTLCNAGLFCAVGELVPDCSEQYCCTQMCDICKSGSGCVNPDCPADALCVPYYQASGVSPLGLESVGMCVVQEGVIGDCLPDVGCM